MRHSFAIVSLLTGLAAACGGVVDDGAAPAEGAAAVAETRSSSPPSPPPTPCVGHVLTWTGDGGWVSVHAASSITGCRNYERKYRNKDGENARCASELRTAGLWTLRDLTAAIEDPIVLAAFERGGAIGHLASPADGIDDLLFLDGAKLLIGRDPPAPLVHLLEVLRDVDIAECPEAD
jgi:hypothetical protein